MDSLRKSGRDARILEYADAHHAFDKPEHHTARHLSNAMNFKNSSFWETPSGRILDKDPGEGYGRNASCFGRGATVAYNEKAYRQAVKDVGGFLRSALGLEAGSQALN
ncbi:MAG: hypothetical protein KKE57_04075 [Proteobacteria bacterium]|nr:hypothetical protein [Pseudomonadota bacterium]